MDSLQDFLDKVQRVRRRLGIERHAAWFRGHARRNYQLLPGILRSADGLRHEWNLFAHFKHRAGDLVDRSVGSWELLARMQHHGMPTRLLDWTEDLNTALYFALAAEDPEPVVWVLNPYDLNDRAMKTAVVFDEADQLGFDYATAAKARTWPNVLPIAMKTPWRSSRIAAQSGCFTCHGAALDPVSTLGGSALKRIEIPTALVNVLRTDLKRSGIDEFKMFPDLDGLARALKRNFGFQ
jgi:hypothetical protein